MTGDDTPIDNAQDEIHAATTAAGEARDNLNSHEGHADDACTMLGDIEEWGKQIARAAEQARGEVAEADRKVDTAYGDLEESIEFGRSASDLLDGVEPGGEVIEHRITDGMVYAIRAELLGPVSDAEPGLFDPENDAPVHHRDPNDE